MHLLIFSGSWMVFLVKCWIADLFTSNLELRFKLHSKPPPGFVIRFLSQLVVSVRSSLTVISAMSST